MCGIISYVGDGGATNRLLVGLDNLEYRGYDSAGIAVQNGKGLEIRKCSGEVNQLKDHVRRKWPTGSIGIGHTRWSTHGPPTDVNAHPHTDCSGSVAVVHNGIIENYESLKEKLEETGHTFESDTDTEVVPHLIESYIDRGDDITTAFTKAITSLQGSYAIVASIADSDVILAARQGSPLVLGLGDDGYYLASDVPAFLEYVERAIYLEDGDIVHLNPTGYRIIDHDGSQINRTPETITWDIEDAEKGGFNHYMFKEINEQPAAIRRATSGRIADDFSDVCLEDFPPGTFRETDNVQLVACGTSYHAAVYGAHLLNIAGIPAHAYRAGEYSMEPVPVDSRTLVIGVTQSGETADTLESLRKAKQAGVRTLAITNVIGSTAARECDDTLYIRAGPEIGVAATKTFSSQVVSLLLLFERIVRDITGSPPDDSERRLRSLAELPDSIQRILNESSARQVAERYRDRSAYFFIGRGLARPVASEGALKYKEITYQHAEGFAAGELKHGPLALVTPDTPTFAIFTGQHDEKTLNNVQEVMARGAPVIAIAPETSPVIATNVDDRLSFPETHPHLAGVLGNVQLQLLAYHAADALGRSIDKPRNLAKSVTVE